VGISGLQPWTPPLYGNSHLTLSSWSVAVWRCQTAVTPILSAGDSHLLFLPAGSCRRVDRLGGIGGLAQANRHETNPSRIRVHHIGVSDTVSLDGGQAASEGRSESAPFRPDLATQQENHLLESTGWET